MAKNLTKAQQSAKLVEVAKFYEANPQGVMFTAAHEHGPMVASGLVEINTSMVDAQGDIATRPTAAGLAQVAGASAGGDAAATPAAAKPVFTIENAAPPAVTGRGRGAGTETYPFDKLEVGQSFFVPATADKENPAKSLASTVSSAIKRYSTPIEGQTRTDRKGNAVQATKANRKFVVRSRTAAEEAAEGFNHGQNGARVYRVAL